MGLSPAGWARRYVPALRRRLLFRLATSDTYERVVRALPGDGMRPSRAARALSTSWPMCCPMT
jgi:hypothetical protein